MVNFQVVVEILSKSPKSILAGTVANQTGVILAASFQSATPTNHPLLVNSPRPKKNNATRPGQTRYWEYPGDESPLVRVVRFNDGKGGKPNWHQEGWG
jgi:hypothetical protein